MRAPSLLGPALALALASPLLACDSNVSIPSSAFSNPIDFAHACEGEGKTVAPLNDETAASLNQTRMCPDFGGIQGDLFGVVLDRQPASLMVLQLNPASGTRDFIDADYFVPGLTGIPVGLGPVRVLTAPDWSAFYVLSGGDKQVDRVVLAGFANDILAWSKTTFALPGAPIDGAVIGTELVVVPQAKAELWVYDLAASAEAPPLRTIAMPDRPLHVEGIGAADRFLVTFRSRPTVAVYQTDGALLSEQGLVPACRNGLDDDEDGLLDALDPDCLDREDDDESDATGAARVTRPAAAPAFDGPPPCNDGVDNDGDGQTDFPADLACASADGSGELRPQCDDGLDNDRDGLTDLADESCYSPFQLSEIQNPTEGPFHPTFIDGGDFGRFVYVADERTGEIAVFTWDGATLVRVSVHATDATAPTLTSVPFNSFSSETTETGSVPATRSPALHRQGVKNILITETNVSSLSAGRLRGELWDRLIEASGGASPTVSLTPNSSEWKPQRCAPTPTDTCVQPALDDATWLAFGPNLDGRVQLIEAIRRGTPVHRLAQRTTDLSQRIHDISTPRLSLRGRLINARGEPQVGLPFIGAALEEELVARVATESPARFRRFGLWPPADLETALNEAWSVSFEGIVPETASRLGGFADATTFADPNARFCDLGVAAGDWLQLTVPVSGTAPELVHAVVVMLADGRTCPTVEAETALIEIPIAEVGMSAVTLDTSTIRLRPLRPALDADAVSNQGLPRRACEEAITALDDTLGLPENLRLVTGFATTKLPAALTYNVRSSSWIVVGTRSGFLHRQRWDRLTSTCALDDTLDARVVGRLSEVTDATPKYAACPPSTESLGFAAVDQIADPDTRFFNPSFGLDIFPACTRDGQTSTAPITAVPSQQDTVFTFTVTGPLTGSALSVSDSLLLMRVPLLDFRRQQVQLDSAARKASILQLRLGDPRVIATFE